MNNECLICLEECNEIISCCNKNIHLKCLNSYWQYNKNNYGICPHCTNNIENNIIDIESGIENNDIESGINNIENNVIPINNNEKVCLKYGCCGLSFILLFLFFSIY